jgi:adenosylcobinamide-GDP ribazoletransferase
MPDGYGKSGERGVWRGVVGDTASCIRFFSRLPLPVLPLEHDPHGAPDMERMVRVIALAGIVIGVLPGVIFTFALLLGLGSWLAACLAIATLTFSTGALHEDGLADCADSFGGVSRERKLEIMKDSRLGSYGACALVLAFALRLGGLEALAQAMSPGLAGMSVVVLASVSRTAALAPFIWLGPARHEGASHSVGTGSTAPYAVAVAICAVISMAFAAIGRFGPAPIGLMGLGAGLAAWTVTRWAARSLGGQTGDVGGAAQQLAEIGGLLGLLIGLRIFPT